MFRMRTRRLLLIAARYRAIQPPARYDSSTRQIISSYLHVAPE